MRKYSSESGAWSKQTSVAVVVPSGFGTLYVNALHGPCASSQKARSARDSLQLRFGLRNWNLRGPMPA